jgi:tetratricopeptide (TPR) repeat protein
MSFIIGFSQQSKVDEIGFQKKILKKAKAYGDPEITKNTFYKLIVLEGENSTYKDSLAYLYFSTRKYAPCFMVTQEILKRNPKHKEMLEIQAISLESLGAYGKAIEDYKKLFAMTSDNYFGYSLAKLNYNTKKFDEAYSVILETEKLNDTGNYKVTYSINKTHTQQIELLAAIQYLKGLIATELKKKDVAKASFQKALSIQPEFVLAKEKLENLD